MEFCSEILDTGVSILDELSSKTTNTLFVTEVVAQEKPVRHLLRMSLQGLSGLLQNPAHNQDEHNSPSVFRLTIVLCEKHKVPLFISMRQLHWHSGDANAGSPGTKIECGSTFVTVSSGKALCWKTCTFVGDDVGTYCSMTAMIIIL